MRWALWTKLIQDAISQRGTTDLLMPPFWASGDATKRQSTSGQGCGMWSAIRYGKPWQGGAEGTVGGVAGIHSRGGAASCSVIRIVCLVGLAAS